MIFRPRFSTNFKSKKPWSVPDYCVSPIICMVPDYLLMMPNVKVSDLHGFSRRSARLPGWASRLMKP